MDGAKGVRVEPREVPWWSFRERNKHEEALDHWSGVWDRMPGVDGRRLLRCVGATPRSGGCVGAIPRPRVCASRRGGASGAGADGRPGARVRAGAAMPAAARGCVSARPRMSPHGCCALAASPPSPSSVPRVAGALAPITVRWPLETASVGGQRSGFKRPDRREPKAAIDRRFGFQDEGRSTVHGATTSHPYRRIRTPTTTRKNQRTNRLPLHIAIRAPRTEPRRLQAPIGTAYP